MIIALSILVYIVLVLTIIGFFRVASQNNSGGDYDE